MGTVSVVGGESRSRVLGRVQSPALASSTLQASRHNWGVAPNRLQTLGCSFAARRHGIEREALCGSSPASLAVKRRCLWPDTGAPVASALPDGLFSLSSSCLPLFPLPQPHWRGKTLTAPLVPARFGCVAGDSGCGRTHPARLRSPVVSRPGKQGVWALSRAEWPTGLLKGCSWFLCLWGALEPPKRRWG